MSQARPILIAGAGIGGLTLALELSRRSLPARILERRRQLSEAGAGIQIGPNGMRVLAGLGVDRRLEPAAGKPLAIAVADGASGRIIAELPLGRFMLERHGAPYWVAHRADLQAALLAAVREAPGIELVTGFEAVAFSAKAGAVRVAAGSGAIAEGHALVGADGLWSAVRRHLFPGREPRFAGKMAVRTVIEAHLAQGRFAEPSTGVWLGRDAHVVHYPIRGGRAVAAVVIAQEAAPRQGWGEPVEREIVLQRIAGFAPELRRFLGSAQDWSAWSLFDPDPLPFWSEGPVGLIGDAAHPILPFIAQGGVMALEDAATLAEALAAFADDPARAFKTFEAVRWRRVARVQQAARANGRLYHLSGLAARARDLTLGAMPGHVIMARYDWLYGWKGDAISTPGSYSAARDL